VEKLVYGGEGLARVDGRVVLTPFVLPGERVQVEPRQEKPGLVRADPIQVIAPAAERAPAPCPYFGRCGGCHYQHAPYDYQLALKRQILIEELRRIGRIEPPEEIGIVSGEPWGYRNRAQFHIEDGRLGYREARSHRLCAIERCPIGSPRINELITTLLGMLRNPRWPGFVRSLEVFTDERQVQINILDTARPVARRFFEWCAEEISGLVTGALDYEGRFRVGGNSFFQVNRFLPDRLVETAIGDIEGEAALDLYAGVGLFTLPLARRFRQVTAVESGRAAAGDLEFNAERAGLGNIAARQRTAEDYLASLEKAPDFVLLDPPRAGLGKAVARRLVELRPPRVTIVSCDPATLARDLAALIAGGFHVGEMTLVDLFPQTFHLETVVTLV
jgi:23S rRNA (uracil1939-C5)-methyltransferase